jgi:VWFA-related protein
MKSTIGSRPAWKPKCMHTRIRTTLLIVFLAAASTLAQQPPPQQPPPETPPPTFRVEVNYVEVDALVTDANGNPVSNLTVNDFEVLEDGKPQKISAFSLVNIPIDRAERPLFAASPIESDVHSNADVDGRVYLIVLDDLHVHPMRSSRVKAAARRFIERHFAANDLAAIVYTSGRSDAGQEFTNNRRLLLASVDKFSGRKLRSSTLSRLEQYRNTQGMRSPGERVEDPELAERAHHARNSLESLENLANYMAGVRGRRKAMLFVSEGIDYDIHDVFTNRDASTIMEETRDAIGAATRANVAIYAIDPRGLTSLGDEMIEVDSFPTDDPEAGISSTGMMSELRLAQDSLRTLADETGGFAAVNSNDFEGAFDRLVRDNSTYYVLGYYPANDRRDGRFRKIDVRVKRPGLQVRSRKGYQAPRGRAPETKAAATPLAAAMREGLGSPLPMAGIGMRAFAAPFKGNAPNAAVALVVEIDAGAFQYVEKNGVFTNDIEVAVTATDAKGKAYPGERNTINLAFKPDTLSRVKARGFRVVSQIDLPPGRYQLRVAAAESTGKAGSVFYDVEIPDFYKAPFTMSGLAITSASAAQTPTARAKDPLKDFLPAPPVARRDFQRGDELALFAEIYENAPGGPPHKVDITTTLRSDEGRVLFQNQEERSSTELQAGRGGYGYNTRIPLTDLEPGVYVIHVEAKSRTESERGVGRDVQITVR